MIKIKDILFETLLESKAGSWLTNHGKFIPVEFYHSLTAIKITGINNNDEAMSILWKRGWQRITYYSRGRLFCHNEFFPPSDYQKKLLIDLTKELGFEELVYDTGKSRKILWSKDDLLETDLQ